MAIKKSALYSSLWKSCDELRGGMDASQYKDFVLTLLFVKYVSDKYAGKPDSLIEVPAGGSFSDLVALKGDKEIGDKINKAISKLAEANGLKGVIDVADFNDEEKLGKGKEMQDRLSKLVSIFNDLDFRSNRAEGDDLLGDAYEYLMRHFATESGKSKGQFYTPAEVSRIMAKVIGIGKDTRQDQTVYDPTCGSGSLLLKAVDESPNGMSIYGQEKDVATTALAKMNMILHDNPTAEIAAGGSSTLSDPAFAISASELKTFDFVVANPPFSTKSWQNGFAKDEKKKTITDPYARFDYGVPPAKNGDYAFLLHIVRSLKSTGKGAVILPHGVLFRGNAEATIRKEVVKRGYVKGVIGLPANLFYGTGIPACILVLDKEHAASRKGIFMIDASKGFIKDGNKNRLRSQDLHKIVDVFNKGLEIDGYSRMVPVSEISDPKNDYNLNLPRYIDNGDAADIHDLTAHLKGGIPKRDVDDLERYWDVFKSTRETLFQQNGSPDYLIAQIPSDQVKTTILESSEYQDYAKRAEITLRKWKEKYEPYLKSLKQGCTPKDVIWDISEDLLATFADTALIDKYDMYQHLMNYWSEVMQDDVYQVSGDDWQKSAQIRLIIDEKDKDKKVKEAPDIIVGSGKKAQKFKAELIPPALIVQRYYADEKSAIDELEAQREALASEIEELTEEHSGEEGLLEDAKNDKGKLTKTSLKDRMKEIKGDSDFEDEMVVLKQAQKLLDQESDLTSKIKAKQLELDKKTVSHYAKLSVDEIKELVVCDKWFARLSADVAGEVEHVTQSLATRVKELEERYAHPMPEIEQSVAKANVKVKSDLNDVLTGKNRLPGFHDEWTECQLGERVDFFKGKSLPKAVILENAPNKCIHYGELFTLYPERITNIRSHTYQDKANSFLSKTNDVLMPTSDVTPNGLAKASCIQEDGVILGGDILIIRAKEKNKINGVFLSYLIRLLKEEVMKRVSGTTVYHLYASDLKTFPLRLPSFEEQSAIADILTGVDEEIAFLSRQLEKRLWMKQGMTQALMAHEKSIKEELDKKAAV